MDPSAPPPRTPAQAAASRLNGARSAGPVTTLGKVASAANGIVHGFSANGALMVGETPAMYEANLATWFESLRPASAAEAKLVARLADTDFRQGRLARAEERLVASTVEDQVKGSAAQAALANATEVLAAVQGLVALAQSVPPTVDADAVRRLMPAMEVVLKRAVKLDLPTAVTVPFTKALEDLVLDSFIEVTATGFAGVAQAARAVEAAITEKLTTLRADLDRERERLTELVLFGDGDDARRLDRHRARLGRELEQHARALKAVRELAAGPADGGSGSPVTWLVELRVQCAACSPLEVLRDAGENVPQPGSVGARYAGTRILLVGQNPANPPAHLAAADRPYTAALRALAASPSAAALAAYQERVLAFAPSWPVSGRYFPLAESGLELDQIAYCNLVRCRTRENKVPSERVAARCLGHLERWLDLLQPRAVVFVGKWAWKRGQGAVAARSIPCAFMNRERSLSGEERRRNRAEVAQMVRKYAGGAG